MTTSMTTRPHRARRRATAAGLAALLLLGAACGDDDDDGDEDAVAQDDLTTYCETEVAIDEAFTDADFEDPEAMKDLAASLHPLIDDLEASAPASLAADVEVFRRTVDALAVDGDPRVFEENDIESIDARVHAFDLEECGWDVVEVAAGDFHFDFDPPTRAGTVSFELRNEGDEPHVLVLGRKKDDVSLSALEAFQAVGEAEDPEAEFGKSFVEVGETFAPPGGSDYLVRDLEAGEYLMLCPIPVGSRGEEPGQGPPHFVEGMVETFTVR